MTDIHQRIMDAAYERWQNATGWTQDEFWDQLDARERFAVFTGNLNYQIGNGGWMQWLGNGYATAETIEYLLRNLIKINKPGANAVGEMLQTFKRTVSWHNGEPVEDLSERQQFELEQLDLRYHNAEAQFMEECEAWLKAMPNPTGDLVKALLLARKEIVHHMSGNERLIKSSVTIFGIDKALAGVGIQIEGKK